MVRLVGLEKRYGPTHAVKGLTFDVPKGQVVGLLGPNGAGKSTTMRILAGYLTPSAGSAFVSEIDVSQHPVEARRHVGYLPESNPLYDDMMVKEYLEYVADIRQVPADKRSARLSHAIERCGLKSVLGKDISQLSKGYRQRVGLAQAILHDPGLLILDEPTSGLDPNQILEIRALIAELSQEKTILLSTHILPEVQATCSRVLIISDGKLVADDAPDKLTAQDGGRVNLVVASRYASSIDAAAAQGVFKTVNGVSEVEPAEAEGSGTAGFLLRYTGDDVRRAIFEAAVKSDLVVLEMRRQHVSLEEMFRKLTTTEGPRA